MSKIKKFACYYGQDVSYDMVNSHAKVQLNKSEEKKLTSGCKLWSNKLGRNIAISSRIKEGGQGTVYYSDDKKYVIKIYHPQYRTKLLEAKLNEMAELDCDNDGVCWVYDVLYYNNKFVGMMMPYVNGEQLVPYKTFKGGYFGKKSQVDVVISILEAFEYLHEHNILVGDIKGQNVLVNKKTLKTCLIDIDGAQVGQYPCVVSSACFDAPEVILSFGEENMFNRVDENYMSETMNSEEDYEFVSYYSKKYRKIEHEYYAETVLLYQIMMLVDNNPYNSMNFASNYFNWPDAVAGDRDEELYLTVKREFAFAEKESETRCTNMSDINRKLRRRWSHLPSFIKKFFVDTFSRGIRYTDKQMLTLFRRYREALINDELYKLDNECDNITPNNEISYSKVDIFLFKKIDLKGFSIRNIVKKLLTIVDNVDISFNDGIVRELSRGNSCLADGYKFSLVYDIGILKKISVTKNAR